MKINKKIDPERQYTRKEIAAFLNNAVIAATRPEAGAVTDQRMKWLRPYAKALIAPVEEHLTLSVLEDETTGKELALDKPLLTPEEAVLCLLVAATYIQTKYVCGSEKPLFNNQKYAPQL